MAENKGNNQDPFFHHLELTRAQKIRMFLMSISLAPFKFLFFGIFLTLANILAFLGMTGLTDEQLSKEPLRGWRRLLQDLIYVTCRVILFFIGIWRIRITGKAQATKTDAPILVCASHSTFLDFVAVVATKSTVLISSEVLNPYGFAPIAKFLQFPIVSRSQKVKSEVLNKIRDIIVDERWRQLAIFSEGLATNGTALVPFKRGAFLNGTAVQPLLLKLHVYPDTIRRSITYRRTHGLAWNFWLTLCQLGIDVELEFLPVYLPSEQEKLDAQLYAENVRHLMSTALEIPTIDINYEENKENSKTNPKLL